MRPNVVVSTCLAIIGSACGGDPTELVPLDPLLVRALDLMPSCFLPIVTIGECAKDACTKAREFNRVREEQARVLVAPYIAMTEVIRADPTAESWVVAENWPQPDMGRTQVTITADDRDPSAGAFELDLHFQGTIASDVLPQEIDEHATQFGLYTPNFTMVDLGAGTVRWTEFAVDISGGFFRGCDPATQISFDQRMNDDGVFDLFCWDRGGNRVSCDGADLWPTHLPF